MEIIKKYFKQLTERQLQQLQMLDELYREWNAKINVISRKDIDNLYEHHILHSLAIAKLAPIPAGATVLDVGTGGGFPGIPLAIMFPEAKFTLIDSVGKKLTVVRAAAEAAGLGNVVAAHRNAIEERGRYNFVVSRAVMPAADLLRMTVKNVERGRAAGYRSAMVVMKGGDISEELQSLERMLKSDYRLAKCSIWTGKISDAIGEEYFSEKYIIKVLF